MARAQRNTTVVSVLLCVLLFSLVSPMVDHSEELTNFEVSNSTPLGQAMTVSIGSYPDGVNDATTITVPSGEAVSGIELSLDESVLPVSAAKVFDSSADYDDPLAVYDGMDVNNSVLQILPQGWTYDFEGPNTGPNNWTLGSNWKIGRRYCKFSSIDQYSSKRNQYTLLT